MDDLADSFNHMQLKKALFPESSDPDEEDDLLYISNWKTGLSTRRSLSCGDIRDDEDFYSSEGGKKMILKDQYQDSQARNMLKDVTSSSSWAINSQYDPSEGFARSVNQQCRELFVDLNSFTECSGFTASTPKSNRPLLFSTAAVSKTKETILKSSVEDHNEVDFARRNSFLFPMLLYCTTTANEFSAPIIDGRTKKQNTRTLEAGEIKDHSQASSNSKGNPSFQSYHFQGSDDTTLITSVKNKVRSLNGEGDLWIVQPQALELDTKGKGRFLLINKSSYRDLKFKIVFDGKLINVCPQSGNLRSKSQLGVRINISPCLKENPNEVMEDVIRITCGNIEKRVPVKICKVQKTNSIKDRSFRCF